MRVLLLSLAFALSLASGCSIAPPAPLSQDPDVIALQQRVKEDKLRGALPRLAIAPVQATYSMAFDLEKDPGRIPALLDRGKLTRQLKADIAQFTAFGAPVEVSDPGFDANTRPAEEIAGLGKQFADAARAGAEILLVPKITEFDVYFDKRNGNWVWNVALWLYFWVPAWWVRDEDYAAKARLDCAFYSVSSERLLYRESQPIEVEESLDDFDRGWDFLGIFRVPASLDADQMRNVSSILAPHALRGIEKNVVLEVGGKLPDYIRGQESRPEYLSKDATIHAVLVGVGKYQDDATVDGPDGAPGDVADMTVLLRDHYGVPGKNILALTDARGTKYRIESGLTELARHVRPQDVVVVYFSGCGASGPAPGGKADAGRDAYLLPYDVNARDLARTAIPLRVLADRLRKLPAERIVLIADAAFGPAAGGTRSLRGAAAPESPPPARVFEQATRGQKDLTLFLASGGTEGAEDATDLAEARRGLFTYLLVEGAKSRADSDASGDVSLEELASYVARHVKAQAGLEGVTQEPALFRAGSRVTIQGATGGGSWLPVVREGRGS